MDLSTSVIFIVLSQLHKIFRKITANSPKIRSVFIFHTFDLKIDILSHFYLVYPLFKSWHFALRKLILYYIVWYFPYQSLNRYRHMLVSYGSKQQLVPDYTSCAGENRTFESKNGIRTVHQKKNINHLHCHPHSSLLYLQSLTQRRSPTPSRCCHRFFFTCVPA